MLYMVINIVIILSVLGCFAVAYNRNLYECVLLLGQSFFAFVVTVAVASPVSKFLQGSFDVHESYLQGISSLVIWVIILLGFDPLCRGLLRETGRKMSFHRASSIPGKFGLALASAFLVSGAFALVMVMLPPVEGSYIKASNAKVVGGLHRRAAALYVSVVGRIAGRYEDVDELLKQTQVKAGIGWAQGRIEEGGAQEVEQLISALKMRYGKNVEAETFDQLRELAVQAGTNP